MTVFIAVLWVLGFVMLGSGLLLFAAGAWASLGGGRWFDREEGVGAAVIGILLAGLALWPLWHAAQLGSS